MLLSASVEDIFRQHNSETNIMMIQASLSLQSVDASQCPIVWIWEGVKCLPNSLMHDYHRTPDVGENGQKLRSDRERGRVG